MKIFLCGQHEPEMAHSQPEHSPQSNCGLHTGGV
jgi:hypothetical protein